ncbi:MAG: hypothetical protein QM790_02265 [Nibricoccus sp.]
MKYVILIASILFCLAGLCTAQDVNKRPDCVIQALRLVGVDSLADAGTARFNKECFDKLRASGDRKAILETLCVAADRLKIGLNVVYVDGSCIITFSSVESGRQKILKLQLKFGSGGHLESVVSSLRDHGPVEPT